MILVDHGLIVCAAALRATHLRDPRAQDWMMRRLPGAVRLIDVQVAEEVDIGRLRTDGDLYLRGLAQGLVAVNSIIRDWVKGQVTAVECGVMPFEGAFLAHMVANDGRTVIERLGEIALLPPPADRRS